MEMENGIDEDFRNSVRSGGEGWRRDGLIVG